MKITPFIIFICLFIFHVSGQNTITTSNSTQTSFCAGGNIIVQYTSTGTFPLGCSFNAELSDASGNFTNPAVVGSMPINTGIIAGTIPSNTPFGFNYRVRVFASDPYTIGSVSTTPIIITSTAISATIIARPSTEICHGDTISLWVSFNASYRWSTGQTTQTIHVTESGVYTVNVTNYLTGCEVTSDPVSITVHPTPVVNLGPDLSLCDGQHITLNAGPGFSSYQWNDSSSTQFFNISRSGTYSVIVRDSFGCVGGDAMRAIYHRNPVVNLGSDTNVCGSSFLLFAGAGFSSYNWNNGLSFNPSFLVVSSGQYDVTVVDSYGCTDRDTVMVNIHPLPDINLGNDLSVCGNSILLDAGPGYAKYNWNNGLNSNRYIPVSTSGIYYVKVTDQYGCNNSDTIKIILHSLPDIHLGADVQLPIDDSLFLDAGKGYISYSWSTGQNSESVVIHGSDYAQGSFDISVTVTDSNGCSNTGHILVTLVPSEKNTGFTIFPNPVHDILHVISSQDLSGARPVLYDMLGRYYYPEFSVNSTIMTIDRKNIPNGCYILSFYSEVGFHGIIKFIIN